MKVSIRDVMGNPQGHVELTDEAAHALSDLSAGWALHPAVRVIRGTQRADGSWQSVEEADLLELVMYAEPAREGVT